MVRATALPILLSLYFAPTNITANWFCPFLIQVPRIREQDLVEFLQQLEGRAKDLGITDTQLSLASLVGHLLSTCSHKQILTTCSHKQTLT
jgi:hypothetical protein